MSKEQPTANKVRDAKDAHLMLDAKGINPAVIDTYTTFYKKVTPAHLRTPGISLCTAHRRKHLIFIHKKSAKK